MFYENYARIRDKKGLTDYAVCKMTEISRSTMSEWKNGKYTPKLNKFIKISKALEVDVSVLIEGDANER